LADDGNPCGGGNRRGIEVVPTTDHPRPDAATAFGLTQNAHRGRAIAISNHARDVLLGIPVLDLGEFRSNRVQVVGRQPRRDVPPCGTPRMRMPPDMTRIDESPRTCPTVFSTLACTPCPMDTTSVSAATPTRLPSMTNALRSRYRARVLRLCITRRVALIGP